MKGGTMKAMKKKGVSKIAKGRYAKAVVLRGGAKEKTSGGLTAAMLMKNKRGKVVSKKAHAQGQARFGRIRPWLEAVVAARKALQASGFVPINGTRRRERPFTPRRRLCTQLELSC